MKIIRKSDLFLANHGWLQSRFHFSFAEYYNPQNINFGVLRVLNDDLVTSNGGFPTHPHRDMEIISYVIDGELSHEDSMGNKRTLDRGEVQYMSAGTGVYHSEFNKSEKDLTFLQIWIIPDKAGHEPNYGDEKFKWEDRIDKFFHIVSSKSGNAPIKINQDVNLYASFISEGNELEFSVSKDRQAYMVNIEGESIVNNETLYERDAVTAVEEDLKIKSVKGSHILIIEMKKEV